jgi:hypothetical protein
MDPWRLIAAQTGGQSFMCRCGERFVGFFLSPRLMVQSRALPQPKTVHCLDLTRPGWNRGSTTESRIPRADNSANALMSR